MSVQPKKIAVYGKGGIGKSTTTSNISAALADQGLRVMQVGCDPKSDSTNTLRSGDYIPTILDTLRERKNPPLEDVVHVGYGGVYCVEAGGPAPGVGCAGRGIIASVELLKRLRVFEELELDIVIYDVLGDVVCGGFAVPVQEGIADRVFTVSSADFRLQVPARGAPVTRTPTGPTTPELRSRIRSRSAAAVPARNKINSASVRRGRT